MLIDKIYFSIFLKENTMNLLERSVDKELFSGVYEGKYNEFIGTKCR